MTDEFAEERPYVAPAFTADAEDVAAESESFFQRFLGWLWPDLTQRLHALDEAIHQYPDAPSNYVQRGELYLEMRRYDEAAADFALALALSSAQVEQSDWGVVAQMLQDRAQRGLKKAQARLAS